MGVSGGLEGYFQGEEDPNSNPGQGCTHTIGVHPVEASGASCSWEGAHSWGLILSRADDLSQVYNRMDPRVAGPPNHRSGSPVGLTSCPSMLENPAMPVPVTWADEGENILVNMSQGWQEFPEASEEAGN